MKNLLDNISETTRELWRKAEPTLTERYGKYRYQLCVNGKGEVELYDFEKLKCIAKGNREVQKVIKRLA